MFFRAIPDKKPLSAKEDVDTESIGVKITPLFGFSIPIIVRSGEVNVTATITDLKIPDIKKPTLNFTVHRKGNVSVYGDLVVDYISDKGECYTLANMRGIAVYTTIEKRFMSLKLNNKDNLDLTKGSLKLSYIKRDDNNKNVEIFDTATMLL